MYRHGLKLPAIRGQNPAACGNCAVFLPAKAGLWCRAGDNMLRAGEQCIAKAGAIGRDPPCFSVVHGPAAAATLATFSAPGDI